MKNIVWQIWDCFIASSTNGHIFNPLRSYLVFVEINFYCLNINNILYFNNILSLKIFRRSPEFREDMYYKDSSIVFGRNIVHFAISLIYIFNFSVLSKDLPGFENLFRHTIEIWLEWFFEQTYEHKGSIGKIIAST